MQAFQINVKLVSEKSFQIFFEGFILMNVTTCKEQVKCKIKALSVSSPDFIALPYPSDK